MASGAAAREIHKLRLAKDGVVVKENEIAKLDADEKKASDAVANTRALLSAVPTQSKQHAELEARLEKDQEVLAEAITARKGKGKSKATPYWRRDWHRRRRMHKHPRQEPRQGRQRPPFRDSSVRSSYCGACSAAADLGVCRSAEHLVDVADRFVGSLDKHHAAELASRKCIAKIQADALSEQHKQTLELFRMMVATTATPRE